VAFKFLMILRIQTVLAICVIVSLISGVSQAMKCGIVKGSEPSFRLNNMIASFKYQLIHTR
jgi:hypothetical protein